LIASHVVFPVRYVSEGVAVQTTSRELSALGIAVRSLAPPQVGARVSMALYLPNAGIPEVAIGRVSAARSGAPLESGFWADFVVVDPQARMRISNLLSDSEMERGPRRTFERHAVQLPVRFRTALEFMEQEATNLSRGGVFVRTDDPPPLDTVVEIELKLPDGGPPVTSAGIVVHRESPGRVGKPAGVGVPFVDASDAFRERMDRYMESLKKMRS
jgi:uncharacterized protein (TIGR02266 family)